MTTHLLDEAKAQAILVSIISGCAQHVSIIRRPIGDYGYQVSDWYGGDNAVVGYEDGRVLYDYSKGTK